MITALIPAKNKNIKYANVCFHLSSAAWLQPETVTQPFAVPTGSFHIIYFLNNLLPTNKSEPFKQVFY